MGFLARRDQPSMGETPCNTTLEETMICQAKYNPNNLYVVRDGPIQANDSTVHFQVWDSRKLVVGR